MACGCNKERYKDLDLMIRLTKCMVKIDGLKRIIVLVSGGYYRMLFPEQWDGDIVKTVTVNKNGVAKAV